MLTTTYERLDDMKNYSSGRIVTGNSISILGMIFMFSLASGCAGIDSANMVPDALPSESQSTGQSIGKITVRSEQKSTWGGALFVEEADIHTAVAQTLSNNGFFGSVDQDNGDLDLLVLVRSQNQKTSLMLEYTALITVTYRFSDRSGNVVWAKTLESSGSSHTFAGGTRTREARERSVKANLQALVDELRKTWP